ncbi:MAG: radical SAM protein, partial [Chloroflexota bacterium]|nr:radical SAM protein [Chloroflexota bacterium]
EGKSRMSKENYHRYPDDEKVKGIDYGFYKKLLQGKFDREVNSGLAQFIRERSGVFEGALIKA